MFFEITKEAFEKMKTYLTDAGYQFEVSDCTISGENVAHAHIEILTPNLTQSQIKEINEKINIANKEYYKTYNKDIDEDGIPDRLENDEKLVEVRRRPWDDKTHTLKQELAGHITGKAQEEEVTYEYR